MYACKCASVHTRLYMCSWRAALLTDIFSSQSCYTKSGACIHSLMRLYMYVCAALLPLPSFT